MRRIRLLLYVVTGAVLHGVSPTAAQSPGSGHGFHPPMPDQELFLECRLGNSSPPTTIEFVLPISVPMAPLELNHTVTLPAPWAPIQVKQYLPRAVRDQNVVPVDDEQGQPSVLLSVEGPTGTFDRWLVAGDAERNRLVSLIGTWRYMAVADPQQRDELFRQFEQELTRTPMLRITRVGSDEFAELPAKPGETRTFENLGVTVTVRRFYSDFGLRDDTKEPINRSDKLLNPAALVEIDDHGKKEEQWVFAKFSDFMAHESGALPYRVTLDCPLERKSPIPDYVIATVARARHEVWTRYQDQTTSKPLELNESTKVAGSKYSFALTRFLPSGRLVETYRPTEGKGAVTALRVDITGATGASPAPCWLELGKPRVIPTQVGPLTLTFASRPAGSTGGHR
jgi:hypothetical protein